MIPIPSSGGRSSPRWHRHPAGEQGLFRLGSGGGDLPSSQKELFGGGTGGGVTITPLAFLIVKNGDVKLLQVQSYNNTADRVVGMVPDVDR